MRTYYFLGVLALVNLINFMDRQIISILLVPIQQDLQVSDTAMGLLTGVAFAIFYATVGIPLARWCDIGNRRNILTLLITVWSTCTMLCAAATSYVQLLLARIGVALGEAGGNPASISLISDYFPLVQRATALGVYYTGPALGIFIGMWMGGWINDLMGWRAAFIAVGAPGLIVAMVLYLTVSEPVRGATESTPRTSSGKRPAFFDVLRYLASLPTFRLLVVGNACQSLAAYAAISWSPAFFIRVHEMSVTEVGLWVGMMSGLGYGFGNLVGGWLSDRLGRRDIAWYPGVAALWTAFGLVAVFLVTLLADSRLAILAFLPMTLGIGASSPAVAAITQALATPSTRAMSFTTQYAITAIIGQGAGPLLVGLSNDLLAPSLGIGAIRYSLLLIVSSALVITTAAYVRATRTMAADVARASSLS